MLQMAIEIGYSCDMEVMILSADLPEETRSQIEGGWGKRRREGSSLARGGRHSP